MIKEEKAIHLSHSESKQVWLAMDTSTASMTVALMKGNERLDQLDSVAERNHSIYLLPMVKKLLEQNSMKPRDLSGIAVGVGPGSYTGVRIAVTAAKTMAWALGCPVIGVSSLEALALGANFKGEGLSTAIRWYVPLMNGRRGQAYTALFASDHGEWSRLESDAILLMDSWLERLKASILNSESNEAPQELWFVGEVEPFDAWIDSFKESCKGRILVNAIKYELSSDAVGQLALQKLATGGQPDEVHDLLPNYAQLAEAEAKLLEKNKGGRDYGTRPTS